MMKMADTTIKRLMVSRYLYTIAADHVRLNRDVASFVSINMMQDAIELFLAAAADHLNLGTQVKTEFLQYIDKINDKITPKELPFRRRLIELNKVRVFAKHDGVRPDQSELHGYIAVVREFLDQACIDIFSRNFWTISMVHLIKDEKISQLLLEAESLFELGKYELCLIECRKVLFEEFEVKYNISCYLDENKNDTKNVLWGYMSRAPYFAKNKEYIEKNVQDPFDFIVIDHSDLDSNLMKMRINHEVFWNICRLTPEVYRLENGSWISKHHPSHIEPDGARTAYVFENTVEIALKCQNHRSSLLSVPVSRRWIINLQNYPVKLLKKASFDSEVICTLSSEIKFVNTDYGTSGLFGEGYFWKVWYFTEEKNPSTLIFGYISNEYVIQS